MIDFLKKIDEKKARLDTLKPFRSDIVQYLSDYYRVELTYTSNAIEGNTLTRQETAMVVEKGLTVEGKTIREHLEAVNHAAAWDYVGELAQVGRRDITENHILAIHKKILRRIDDAYAGCYRSVAVRIAGSPVVLPNPLKVPELMADFMKWLHSESGLHPVMLAADAHYKLVSIHPFIDGNGRTARLILDLLLLQEGYPPAYILKEERRVYIDSIEKAQRGGTMADYYDVILRAVDRSLDVYLDTFFPSASHPRDGGEKLMKIGELAVAVNETVPTLRHWIKEGLLRAADHTPGGYSLFSKDMIDRVQKIRALQTNRRLTITEIRKRISVPAGR